MKTSTLVGFVVGALLGIVACSERAPMAPSVSTPVEAQAMPTTGGYTFPSGAGMTEQREWLFIRPSATTQYGPVGIAGQVHLTSLEGSGTRFLCVDGNNRIFASPVQCR